MPQTDECVPIVLHRNISGCKARRTVRAAYGTANGSAAGAPPSLKPVLGDRWQTPNEAPLPYHVLWRRSAESVDQSRSRAETSHAFAPTEG
eukprot:1188671-Prorocentrum_minimum.AAC.1